MSTSRDRYSDASRDGSGQLQKKDVGFELDFGPMTVEEEKQAGGWQNDDTPTGAVRPAAQTTATSR